MFTGIIECLGTIEDIVWEGSNCTFTIKSDISSDLKIDQSVCHNGVCLTVTKVENNTHQTVAIKETLDRSNLGNCKIGHTVNLERSVSLQSRMDGHMVQGHVDEMVSCAYRKDEDGSWRFGFDLPAEKRHLLVQKGSVCINGVSLTVILPDENPSIFEVAIIPYTFEHTTFHTIKPGDRVNIEYDIIGKYVDRFMQARAITTS